MRERDTSVEPELVAGRTCGSCNVCCIALTIDDPELQKVQGHRCHNALPDNSCAIYATRPQTCRTFFCGWRRLKWIRETLRPDTSGVLVRIQNEGSATNDSQRFGVVFTLLTGAAVNADGLAETVAAAVAADVPVYLYVPGPPGHTASQVQINEVLREAVLTKNKPAVLHILRRIRKMGRSMPHERVVLARRDASDSGQPPNA
jgi:hypothetical protein